MFLLEVNQIWKLDDMDLVALEEIRRVKYRYLRCVDLKLWDEMEEVFTPDARAEYGTHAVRKPLKLHGRAEIVKYLRDNLGPSIITVHRCGQPEIDIDGDTATGTWSFEDTVIAMDFRVLIKGAAFYEDTYQRGEDGKWRISHIGYKRIYETMSSLDDSPSLRFIDNMWAPPKADPQAAEAVAEAGQAQAYR